MVNKNYRLLWFGRMISQLGDEFYAIALAWWILQETGSSAIMGLFLFSSVIPGLLFGMFAGALTDRWNRKWILVITDLIQGVLVLTISMLAMFDLLAVWHVFVIGIGLSLSTAFYEPTIQAIIPDVVAKEDLKKANSLSQLIAGICQVAGPMLGALTVSFFGITAVFVANSISCFAAAILAAFLVWKRELQVNAEAKPSLFEDIREGLCFVRGQRSLIVILIIIGIAHFFVGGLIVTLPFLAADLKGNGVNNLGYLQMLMGIGLIGGSLIGSRRRNTTMEERVLIRLIIAFGACMLVISGAQYLRLEKVAFYMPVLLLVGVVIAKASIFWQLLLQLLIPANMTGRVFSISTLIGNVSLPIAYGLVGIILDYHSITLIMFVNGVCLILLSMLLLSKQAKVEAAQQG